MNEEYIKDREMSYDKLCDHLKEKYGEVPDNYFLNYKCTMPNNKIKRGKEGLFIHHIKEYSYEAVNLGDKELARRFPFEYQTPKYLVYCNYIEHCILHEKIYEYRLTQFSANIKMEDGLTIYMLPQGKYWYQNPDKVIATKDEYFYNVIKEDYDFFSQFYNNFYKTHPQAPKYGLRESKSVQKTGKSKKSKK